MGKTVRNFGNKSTNKNRDENNNLHQFLSGKPAPKNRKNEKHDWSSNEEDYLDDES